MQRQPSGVGQRQPGVEQNRFRSGPWPGLTPAGALVLLACAALLGVLLAFVGAASRAWPDLLLVVAATLVPLVLATLIVRAPGSASAVAGAYLLPATALSLLDPSLPLPPLLLAPAMLFDLTAWLRPSDIRAMARAWPRRGTRWRKRDRAPRRLTWSRVVLAATAYAIALAAMEPAWRGFAAL